MEREGERRGFRERPLPAGCRALPRRGMEDAAGRQGPKRRSWRRRGRTGSASAARGSAHAGWGGLQRRPRSWASLSRLGFQPGKMGLGADLGGHRVSLGRQAGPGLRTKPVGDALPRIPRDAGRGLGPPRPGEGGLRASPAYGGEATRSRRPAAWI